VNAVDDSPRTRIASIVGGADAIWVDRRRDIRGPCRTVQRMDNVGIVVDDLPVRWDPRGLGVVSLEGGRPERVGASARVSRRLQ
jgi:hypothetical protein